MYRITIDPDAMEQIDALPFTAALGYAEALEVMTPSRTAFVLRR
jgi:hypothetical protein